MENLKPLELLIEIESVKEKIATTISDVDKHIQKNESDKDLFNQKIVEVEKDNVESSLYHTNLLKKIQNKKDKELKKESELVKDIENEIEELSSRIAILQSSTTAEKAYINILNKKEMTYYSPLCLYAQKYMREEMDKFLSENELKHLVLSLADGNSKNLPDLLINITTDGWKIKESIQDESCTKTTNTSSLYLYSPVKRSSQISLTNLEYSVPYALMNDSVDAEIDSFVRLLLKENPRIKRSRGIKNIFSSQDKESNKGESDSAAQNQYKWKIIAKEYQNMESRLDQASQTIQLIKSGRLSQQKIEIIDELKKVLQFANDKLHYKIEMSNSSEDTNEDITLQSEGEKS